MRKRGALDAGHRDIQRDLARPHEPHCSFGFLLEALDRRKNRGQAPFTLMSCDNIQGNGDTLKTMLLAFAELRDPILANWMAQNLSVSQQYGGSHHACDDRRASPAGAR